LKLKRSFLTVMNSVLRRGCSIFCNSDVLFTCVCSTYVLLKQLLQALTTEEET